jgi:transcription initiation protein SPT3
VWSEKVRNTVWVIFVNGKKTNGLSFSGFPAPTQKDFEYLMRKNPVKILRLRKDLFMLKRFRELIQNYNDTDCQADSDEEALLEVQDKYDEEKTRRLFRADRISQILSGTQYKEFNEARKNG